MLGLSKSRTTAYRLQGSGAAERMNRTLKSLLRAFVDTEHT